MILSHYFVELPRVVLENLEFVEFFATTFVIFFWSNFNIGKLTGEIIQYRYWDMSGNTSK